MRKLLPILLALIGLVLGAGAGFFLHKPAAPEAGTGTTEAAPDAKGAPAAAAHDAAEPAGGHGEAAGSDDYVKLNNQFIVPIVKSGKVVSLIILSLSLQVTGGESAKVYAVEPKLRDAFLQVLFDHANAGGFGGNFIEGSKLQPLRDALLEAAGKVLGPMVTDVLITDIIRQDA